MNNQILSRKDTIKLSEKIVCLRQSVDKLLDEVNKLDQTKTIEISQGVDFYEEVKSFEIQLIKQALELTAGSQMEAAKLLNLNRSTLNCKIKLYNIHIGSLVVSHKNQESAPKVKQAKV